MLVQVTNVLVGFPLSVLLARSLGPAGKGSLSIVQLVAESGALVLCLGLPSALSYFAAKGTVDGRGALKVAALMSTTAGLLTTFFILAAPASLAHALFRSEDNGLLLAALGGIAFTVPVMMLGPFGVAKGDVRRSSLVTICAVLYQLAVDSVLALAGLLMVHLAILVWLSSVLLSVAGFSAIAWSHRRPGRTPLRELVPAGLRFGLAAWLSSIAQYLSLRQDLFLIALFLGPGAVGVYTIAVTFAQLATFVPNALSGVLMPKVAGEGAGAAELSARLTRTAWPLVGLLALAVYVVAVPLIGPVFGSEFADAAIPLALLVPAMIPYSVNATLSAYVMGSGIPVYATYAWFVNLMINVVANVLLLPRLGIAGAGLSSLLSYSCGAAFMVLAFGKVSGQRAATAIVPRRSDYGVVVGAIRRTLAERRAGV